MDDYIKRSNAVNAIDESLKRVFVTPIGTDIMRTVPGEDVAPVRHGRWKCGEPCPVCGKNRFDGLDADIWADWTPPYCPNCGAKMNGDA